MNDIFMPKKTYLELPFSQIYISHLHYIRIEEILSRKLQKEYKYRKNYYNSLGFSMRKKSGRTSINTQKSILTSNKRTRVEEIHTKKRKLAIPKWIKMPQNFFKRGNALNLKAVT